MSKLLVSGRPRRRWWLVVVIGLVIAAIAIAIPLYSAANRGALAIQQHGDLAYASYDPLAGGPSTSDAIQVQLIPESGCLVVRRLYVPNGDGSSGVWAQGWAILPYTWTVEDDGVIDSLGYRHRWGETMRTSSAESPDVPGRWDREAAGHPCYEELGTVVAITDAGM